MQKACRVLHFGLWVLLRVILDMDLAINHIDTAI